MTIYTRPPRSLSVQKVDTVEQFKLWFSLGIYVCAGLWSSLGRHCYHLIVVYLSLVMWAGISDIWFKVKFDLHGKGQSLPNTMGILMKVFCISYIWEILAWVRGCGTGKKLIHTKLRIMSIYEMEIQRTQVNLKIIWEMKIRTNETEILMP